MKNSTNIKIPKKHEAKIREIYHDEDGYWAYSERGYCFPTMDMECHTAHEDKQSDLLKHIRNVEKCNCKWCTSKKE